MLTIWAGPTEKARLGAELAAFSARLGAMPGYANVRPLTEDEVAEAGRETGK